jgi:hypothetical protein
MQDRDGIIYIGSYGDGILTFDGQKIRRVIDKQGNPLSGLTRAVLMDSKNIIYTIIKREFGTIEKNQFGESVYIPISDTLQEKNKVTSSIWSSYMHHDTCFIQSEKAVYLLKDKKVIQVIHFDHQLTHNLKVTNDGVYLRVWGIGYHKYVNGAFKLIPSTKELFAQSRVDQQFSLKNGDNLLISRNVGAWYLKPDWSLVKAKAKELDEFAIKGEVYVGSGPLKNGLLPITSSKKGILFVDEQLNVKNILDTSNGLTANNVSYYIQDRTGDIWGVGDNVFRAGFDTTFTYFSNVNGLVGSVEYINRINGVLYARSNKDLYKFVPKQSISGVSTFQKASVNESGSNVLSFDDQIITTNNYDIKTTRGLVTKVISPIYRSTNTIRSKLNPSLIFSSNYNVGLLAHEYKNGNWKQVVLKNKDTILCNDLVEPFAGTILVNTLEGIYKYQYDKTGSGVFTKLKRDTAFTKLEYMRLLVVNGNINLYYDSAYHFYSIDLQNNKLVYTHFELNNLLQSDKWCYNYNPNSKNGWLFTQVGLYKVAFDMKKGFSFTTYPFYKVEFSELSGGLLAEGTGDNEVLWIGSQDDKIYRYYPELAKKEKKNSYKALVRAIFANGQKTQIQSLELPFSKNNLTFEVAYPVFGNESKTTFSYWLEGQDSTWTPFVADFKKEYTNLHEGNYIFHVRAKEASGAISQEGTISFVIHAPWYRTIWAYGLYLLTLVICFIQFGKYQAKKSFQKAENDRKNSELSAATDLQKRLLPKTLPQISHLDISAYLRTSTEVGGDYYDFFEQPDGSLYAICGDATGHGTPSGMLVSITKAGIIGLPQMSPQDMLHELNRVVKKVDLGILRMSLNIALIKDNQITLSSAGMPPYYLYHAHTNTTEEIMLSGIPLGSFNNVYYDQTTAPFNTGDILVILSDGLPEAPDANGVLFDYPQVQSIINKNHTRSAQALIELLMLEADSWLSGVHNPDDITIVIIKHK